MDSACPVPPGAVEPGGTANPLAGIPPEIADRLRPYFDDTIEQIVAAIQARIAEYDRPSDQVYLKAMRVSVRDALGAFLDRIGAPDPPGDELRERFRALGAGEAHEGRSLDSLQTAMRTTAVIAWRRITELQMDQPAAFPRRYIGPMAEAAFLFLEEIAAAAMEGYAGARSRRPASCAGAGAAWSTCCWPRTRPRPRRWPSWRRRRTGGCPPRWRWWRCTPATPTAPGRPCCRPTCWPTSTGPTPCWWCPTPRVRGGCARWAWACATGTRRPDRRWR
ncbi:hypothetical protein ACFPZ0_20610 [Streptomonospora nanhaiensis]|uniref:hypothetical protein n=1 Tax=Streptomonospora nanhaiensis TaxID=1323731 RepID=UPI0027E10323|nr:hypothetical protein [Streptomonospora nanhaiensis]